MKAPDFNLIKRELQVQTSRSGGPGGQHVNKVETRVSICWSVRDSFALTDAQREVLFKALSTKLSTEGVIQVSSEAKRSQLQNKRLAFHKLEQLIKSCFIQKRKRIPTKPTKASQRKRVEGKKLHAEKKAMRKRIL